MSLYVVEGLLSRSHNHSVVLKANVKVVMPLCKKLKVIKDNVCTEALIQIIIVHNHLPLKKKNATVAILMTLTS